MERLTISPLAHIVALIVCMNAILGVLIEIVHEVWECTLRLFFELPLMTQLCELTGWYLAFAGLTWALISMTSSPDDEDDESPGWLVIVSIDYGPVD